jgi:hypothetical protein
MKSSIISLLIGISIGFIINTKTCNNFYINKNFEHINDSLDNVVDSLDDVIAQENKVIAELNKKDSMLVLRVEDLTEQRDEAREEARRRADDPNLHNTDSLLKFYANRYPTNDRTILNLPKTTLFHAAKDLILCDGTKNELKIADSTITTLNERIFVKDTTINSYKTKDTAYQALVKTKDAKYDNLDNEYKGEKSKNGKLKKYLIGTSTLAIITTLLLLIK